MHFKNEKNVNDNCYRNKKSSNFHNNYMQIWKIAEIAEKTFFTYTGFRF